MVKQKMVEDILCETCKNFSDSRCVKGKMLTAETYCDCYLETTKRICSNCLHFVNKKCAKGEEIVYELAECLKFTQSETDSTNPSYYRGSEIECIEVIRICTTEQDLDGIEGFDIGQVIKYIWRFKKKNGLEDLKKAKWYLEHLIKLYEGAKNGSDKK